MRLKNIEVIGFKSFVDRTVVNFDAGITAIVGPNGSGKSNVVDAIRWVMGEQSAKHLRGSEMSDVIFNGSDSRPATGMASVFLTFDNSDGRAPADYSAYSEITLGRRLYRSGESEYYINKVPCRLKDIVEFFLGTGVGTKAYSIVEQGQVEKIVSAKPEERRQLLEEAAGISKFKMHRDSALRKIEATKQNLARLSDIIVELEHQKNSLSRQAKKAERYKIFADELQTIELSLASHNYKKWSGELNELRTRLTGFTEEETVKSAQVSEAETTIDSMKISLSETERSLNSVQERIYELQNRLRLNESEINHKTDNLEERKKRELESRQEIESLNLKKSELDKQVEEANNAKVNADLELASFEETAATAERSFIDAQGKVNETNLLVESSRKETVECIKITTDLKARVENIERRETDIASRIAKNQTEIDSIDQRNAEIESGIAGANNELVTMKGTKQSLEDELFTLQNDAEKTKNEIHHNESDVGQLSATLSNKKSRLVSLEELNASFEGYNEGVRAVLKKRSEAEAGNFGGVFGTVSDMIETEPQYEAAVTAALGEKLQYVVVRSHQEGVEAIDYLKAQSAGRSTFVPMELRSSDESQPEPQGEGIIGPLLNYVNFSNEYSRVGKYLFGDIVLIEDIRKALNIWQANGTRKTFVTLDGEVVDPSGIVSGGFANDNTSTFLAKKREVSELRIEVARLQGEVSNKSTLLAQLRSRLQVGDARIGQLKTFIHTHDVQFVHKERDAQGLASELESLKKTRDNLAVETAELSQQLDQGNVEKIDLSSRIKETEERHISLENNIASMIDGLETLKIELNTASNDMTDKKIQLASLQEQNSSLEREFSRLNESLTEVVTHIRSREEDIEEGIKEIEATILAIEKLKEDVGTLVRDIETASAEQTNLKLEYDRLTENLREKELSLREVRKSLEEVRSKVYELKLDETKLSEKIFYLEREIQEKYHFDLPSRCDENELKLESEAETIEQATERISARVAELKDKLDKIGSVNTDAIGEYDGVLQRFEFLTRQSEDLKTSLETLQKAIIRINRTSKERFVETFNAVSDKFRTIFPRLFKGGKADLILLDQDNVLESGIEIIAQPPGKKLQSVSLMSGGEQALVATTFIFSIFLIKPSPFCLLDEVDAPLDDANIDRFNKMVREMSQISQFIMITHNRRTMELADTLYGVTMEEAGISKILSVKLDGVTHGFARD